MAKVKKTNNREIKDLLPKSFLDRYESIMTTGERHIVNETLTINDDVIAQALIKGSNNLKEVSKLCGLSQGTISLRIRQSSFLQEIRKLIKELNAELAASMYQDMALSGVIVSKDGLTTQQLDASEWKQAIEFTLKNLTKGTTLDPDAETKGGAGKIQIVVQQLPTDMVNIPTRESDIVDPVIDGEYVHFRIKPNNV